jgi:glycosyltransferase involved in cell wall biosynthesis
MKIAHVCPFYTPAIGGVKQVVEELAKRQSKQGHDVHVICSDWDKNKTIEIKHEIIDGVKIHRCKNLFSLVNFATFWPSLFSKIREGNFDVIHSHAFGHLHFVLSAFAAKSIGIPHVHTTHCPWTSEHRSTVGRMGVIMSYNFVSRAALKVTDKIIAITPWEMNFIKKFGGREERIVVIPNGMSNSFFDRVKNNDFKKKLGIKDKLVLFFGRLNVTKGPDKFVEIAKMILEDMPEVTFVIRGPDEGMRDRVKELIGNEKRIILLDALRDRKEIIKMYQAADVFLLPSYREGLPLTLFEAMAAGLAVVASPVNGIPFEMKEPENGFLVEYGDNEGFKKRTIELLKDSKLRVKISKNNLEKAKNYKWDIINQRTVSIYKNLIAKKNGITRIHKTKVH